MEQNRLSDVEKERLRVFIEDVSDGFYETDLKGKFTFFNDGLCRIFGRDRRELRGSNFRDFMDEENARRAADQMQELHRSAPSVPSMIRWEIIRPDREIRILEISAGLITDARGKTTGYRGIARDRTAYESAKMSLKESEAQALALYRKSRRAERRWRALLDFLADPVFVFNRDGTVDYLNPAFEKTFGWTLAELKGKRIPFVPDDLKDSVREGEKRLYAKGLVHGNLTRRLTKDGRTLDILLSGAIFYEEGERDPAGQILILRDITREKRVEETNETLYRIAGALPRFRNLDDLLEYIAQESKSVLNTEGATVILLDEKKREFFFRVALLDDERAERKMREIRFPVEKGVAGQVYRTGRALVVPDTEESPYFYSAVDRQAGFQSRSLLDVPIRTRQGMIGVLCAINKKNGGFDETDVELLSAVGATVAPYIENARIHDELKSSYENVRSLNRARERVIHHLSHELKTPLSVLSASLSLMKSRCNTYRHEIGESFDRIFQRMDRNLNRLLEMQYRIEDILRENDYRPFHVLDAILAAGTDLIETYAEETIDAESFAESLRQRIRERFGPGDLSAERIELDRFIEDALTRLRPKFAHRTLSVLTRIASDAVIRIPRDVLGKVFSGLLRNAVENTPDGGRIAVRVRTGTAGPEMEITDFGVGIPEADRRLIFKSPFTTREPLQYASKRPYDFYAGGMGFDLLRMKFFSERYGFSIRLVSDRCRYLTGPSTLCPGDISACDHCESVETCLVSGGTSVIVGFAPDTEAAPPT